MNIWPIVDSGAMRVDGSNAAATVDMGASDFITTGTASFDNGDCVVDSGLNLFNSTVVGNAVGGYKLTVNRKAAEENGKIEIFVDAFKRPQIVGNASEEMIITNPGGIGFNSAAGDIKIADSAAGDVIVFGSAASGENRYFRQAGYITTAGDEVEVTWQVDDVSDNFILDRESAEILAFEVTFPVEMDDDLSFVGAGSGLPFGGFYGNDIGWVSVAFGGGGTFVIISDADIAATSLNNTTFQNTQELLIAKTGKYLITWKISEECAGANKHISLAIGVNGVANAAGKDSFLHVAAGSELLSTGTAILALTATDTLSLMVTNEDDNTQITVNNINLTAVQVGG